MQRRAAAVSAVVLLLIAAGAYAYIGAAQQQEPSVQIEADHTVSPEGDSSTVTRTFGGTEYNFSLSNGSGEVTWTNESARYTATLENNSTTTYQDADYTVLVRGGENATNFTLRETQNVSNITQSDPQVEGIVSGGDGTRYVRYTNGSTEPLDSYLPEPRTHQFSEGDQYPYQNNTTTVGDVGADAVTLAWTAPRTQSASLSEGGNVTLGGETYLAHFENGQLQLSTDFQGYQEALDRQSYFHERINGLWAVTITASLAAVLLLMLAYLPSRY